MSIPLICLCTHTPGHPQVTLAIVICSIAHVLHGVYKPWYAGSPTYRIQHLSLLVTTFVFIMGLLFKVGVRWGLCSCERLTLYMYTYGVCSCSCA